MKTAQQLCYARSVICQITVINIVGRLKRTGHHLAFECPTLSHLLGADIERELLERPQFRITNRQPAFDAVNR